MKVIFNVSVFLSLLLMSCNSEPTLQKYFVKNTENKNFIALDVSSNIWNVDEAKLSVKQKTALGSFDKMNILAFKLTEKKKISLSQNTRKLMIF
jgi:hypothetical protein